jgi:ATP-dependent DNA helicase PIF1
MVVDTTMMMTMTMTTVLNHEQQRAIDAAIYTTDHLLITGSAGTGKSTVLREIIRRKTHLNVSADARRNDPTAVADPFGVTATTGTASILLPNGITLHSFLGIGNGSMPARAYYRRNSKTRVPFLKTVKTILIDEVSMLTKEVFELMHAYLGLVHNRPDALFGGVQLILCGDFFQLPGVNGGGFCFESDLWRMSVNNLDKKSIVPLELTEIYRQGGDLPFTACLNRLREGIKTREDRVLLQTRLRPDHDDTQLLIRPTRLYAKNSKVDEINDREFANLVNYHKRKSFPPDVTISTKASVTAEDHVYFNSLHRPIELCVGAQVMVTTNVSSTVVNGSRGVVKDLSTPDLGVLVTLKNGTDFLVPFATQKVLKVVQVSTLPPAPSFFGAIVENDGANDAPPPDEPEEESRQFFESFDAIIRFLPLRLAYALTIHKSQGVTLDSAILDLGNSIFQAGQAYTGLSRVKNTESLILTNLNIDKFMVDPIVVRFYAAVRSIIARKKKKKIY